MRSLFEESLIEELSTINELQNRVFPAEAPENTGKTGVPRLVFVSSYGVRTKTLDGYRGGRKVPVELNVITETYSEMKQVTASVIELLEQFEGRTIGSDGPYIQELTYYEPQEFHESAPGLHRCLIEFNVFFEEDEE